MSHSSHSVARDRRGQAVLEFALVLPLLLVISLGLIEFGRALSVGYSLSRVSREGANIAARGTALDTVLNVVLSSASDIGLDSRGGAVVSRIRMDGRTPVIYQQVLTPGLEGRSRIGSVGAVATGLDGLGLEAGTTHCAVELFYDYRTITPLPRFAERLFPLALYDRAVF